MTWRLHRNWLRNRRPQLVLSSSLPPHAVVCITLCTVKKNVWYDTQDQQNPPKRGTNCPCTGTLMYHLGLQHELLRLKSRLPPPPANPGTLPHQWTNHQYKSDSLGEKTWKYQNNWSKQKDFGAKSYSTRNSPNVSFLKDAGDAWWCL